MDGARFANALVELGCTPAEMTWKRGVDILSFGATKNGCLMAEAVVVFDERLADSLDLPAQARRPDDLEGPPDRCAIRGIFRGRSLDRQRAAREPHGRASRGGARGASRGAARLAGAGQRGVPDPAAPARSGAAGGRHLYHPWSAASLPESERVGPDEVLVRLVTSFATEEADVETLLALARAAAQRQGPV